MYNIPINECTMTFTTFAPRYELQRMIGYVELDRPFEEASDWLHENLCTRWWHEETPERMSECLDILPQLSLSDAHRQFAIKHFVRVKQLCAE